MKLSNKEEIIEKISSHIISIVILINALQIVLSWDFDIHFNMWIEYIFIVILFIINKFKIVNIKNIVVLLISMMILIINNIFNANSSLDFYIYEFILFSVPLILIFLFEINLTKFEKVFYKYNVITVILYLIALIINPSKIDYMTYGFYSIFSLSYIIIYTYYHKHYIQMVLAIVIFPIILINGNRGIILVMTVTIIMMLLLKKNKIKQKIVYILIISILAMNLTNILKIALNYAAQLGLDTYSVKNLIAMLKSDDLESAMGGRYNIYSEAIKEIDQNILFGMGVAGFSQKYGYFPHNIFLDIYSTFGIILGTVYIIYLLWLGIKMYYISKKHIEVNIMFVFMVANVMKLMLSKTFIYDPTIWLYISLGNLIVTKYKGLIKNEENNSIYTNIQ